MDWGKVPQCQGTGTKFTTHKPLARDKLIDQHQNVAAKDSHPDCRATEPTFMKMDPSIVGCFLYAARMQSVAHHLQLEAIRLVPASTTDADSYARSAFNRYYYATFLCVRRTLVDVNKKYKKPLNHKDMPEILRGDIQKRIKAIQKKADKLGDVSLVNDCRQASSQNLTFAQIMEKAYATRVVADYKPETAIDFSSDRFTLSGVAVTEAHDWLSKANLWSILLLNVVRQENA